MIEPKKRESTTLIRCDSEKCGGISFLDELEESDWKCPHCGKPFRDLNEPSSKIA